MATNHLINLGHTRIATIGAEQPGATRFTVPVKRTEGFHKAMNTAGLTVPKDYEASADFTVAGGDAAMVQLLTLPDPPTAVFAQSDEMAAGALMAVRRMGLRCPDDISIVGFDNHEIAEVIDLTTISQPVAEQGRLAARQMLQALQGGDDLSATLTVQTHLIVRGTTSPPASTPKDGAPASTSTTTRTSRTNRRRGG